MKSVIGTVIMRRVIMMVGTVRKKMRKGRKENIRIRAMMMMKLS